MIRLILQYLNENARASAARLNESVTDSIREEQKPSLICAPVCKIHHCGGWYEHIDEI